MNIPTTMTRLCCCTLFLLWDHTPPLYARVVLTTICCGGGRDIFRSHLMAMRAMPGNQMTYQANIMKRDPAYFKRRNPKLAPLGDDEVRTPTT